jgi:hypothetical protein
MADRSQHPGQIMENQTRYDLNATIENWRRELAAQAGLTPDVRRELETHLRDAIAGFQQRGLNDEDSFWLARRRVGQPQQLGEEFVKADPVKVWRERMFWMCFAVFLTAIFGRIREGLVFGLLPLSPPGRFGGVGWLTSWILGISWILTPFVVVLIALLMRSEKTIRQFSKFRPLLENRLRLAFTTFVCIAISSTIGVVSQKMYATRMGSPAMLIWQIVITDCFYPLCFALLVIWLVPAQNRKIPKSA